MADRAVSHFPTAWIPSNPKQDTLKLLVPGNFRSSDWHYLGLNNDPAYLETDKNPIGAVWIHRKGDKVFYPLENLKLAEKAGLIFPDQDMARADLFEMDMRFRANLSLPVVPVFKKAPKPGIKNNPQSPGQVFTAGM